MSEHWSKVWKLPDVIFQLDGFFSMVQQLSLPKHAQYPNMKPATLCSSSRSAGSPRRARLVVKVELRRILVTWWKDLSPGGWGGGVNSSIQTGTVCSLGDGSETRRIHHRLSGYFLNIGTRTETLLKVKPNLV